MLTTCDQKNGGRGGYYSFHNTVLLKQEYTPPHTALQQHRVMDTTRMWQGAVTRRRFICFPRNSAGVCCKKRATRLPAPLTARLGLLSRLTTDGEGLLGRCSGCPCSFQENKFLFAQVDCLLLFSESISLLLERHLKCR